MTHLVASHIGPVEKKAIQVTHGANREDTTVLAVCCANGTALDSLIIYKGKNMQSTWKGDNTLPKTFYTCSENGWMTTTIFHGWFEKFVEEQKVRPLILLFHGHMTHLAAATVQLAIKENISLVKLPPAHCTDLLQPLDVCCFSPLKSEYEKELTKHVHNTLGTQQLKRAQFCGYDF